MVYWAFAAMLLGSVLMTPVRVGAVYVSGQERPLRLGVMIWAVRLSLPMPRLRLKGKATPALPPRALLRAARLLLSGVSAERLALDVSLHLTDAAATATVCGLIQGALACLKAACPGLPLTARVSADFTGPHSRIRAGGILSLRVGHIIRAGGSLLLDSIAGRLQALTNTRLKAS